VNLPSCHERGARWPSFLTRFFTGQQCHQGDTSGWLEGLWRMTRTQRAVNANVLNIFSCVS